MFLFLFLLLLLGLMLMTFPWLYLIVETNYLMNRLLFVLILSIQDIFLGLLIQVDWGLEVLLAHEVSEIAYHVLCGSKDHLGTCHHHPFLSFLLLLMPFCFFCCSFLLHLYRLQNRCFFLYRSFLLLLLIALPYL